MDSRRDELFEAFAAERRRRVLARLHGAVEREVPVARLTDYLAGVESDDAEGDVALSLRHVHIPKLVDAGLVDYERERDIVRYRHSPAVETVLELCEVGRPADVTVESRAPFATDESY